MTHPERETRPRDTARNQDGIGERELLAVSFGTSYPESRKKTIGAIEDALEEAFPAYALRRAFTSQVVISLTEQREGLAIDNVDRALRRAVDNGVRELVVQPTHLLSGLEYQRLLGEVERRAGEFVRLGVGKPLLTAAEDFTDVARALIRAEAPRKTDRPPWSSWDTVPPPGAMRSTPAWSGFCGRRGADTGLWERWRPLPL